nr:MAG TPA: hypothetical protein [Caudoviricetes sp.]
MFSKSILLLFFHIYIYYTPFFLTFQYFYTFLIFQFQKNFIFFPQ